MCTAMSLTAQQHYFGRTLDLDYRHEEKVIIMPRRYPMPFCRAGTLYRHFSMIGTAHAPDGVPLYYDATNEHGLSMAGLRFVGCAHYPQERDGFDNIAPFELIPWVLGQCRTVDEAKQLLLRYASWRSGKFYVNMSEDESVKNRSLAEMKYFLR